MNNESPIADRGRTASSPWQMPLAAWKDVAVRVWNQSWADNIGLVAAGVAFYGFLALVPMLGILVMIYGLLAEPGTVIGHVSTLLRFLPADVALLIGQLLLNAVKSSENASGFGFMVATLVALYAGSNGAGAIMTSLNIAYEEKEKRSLVRFYGIALTITVTSVLLALLALFAVGAIAALETLFPQTSPLVVFASKLAFYLLLGLGAAGAAATLYRCGPSRENARWQWLTAGSIFTALVWLILTVGFGFYVTRLTDYNATYGSIAAIVMLLTWLYLTAYVFLFGAELNAELEHQTMVDSTTGKAEPLGKRGAWAADHVAGSHEDGITDAGPTLSEAGPPNPSEEAKGEQKD